MAEQVLFTKVLDQLIDHSAEAPQKCEGSDCQKDAALFSFKR